MNDHYYMKHALNLAMSTNGQTTPNPAVGAVIVKNNQIVGMGAHLKAGEPHAEVHAIRMAGDHAKGATMYVTLEPCCHFGKTPPCADLVIKSGVKRVVIAMADPNPKISGKGIERLQDAGLQVEVGVLNEDASQINQVFTHFIQTGLPFVTLKSAISLDGKIATKEGKSKWITSSEAREDVHYFRHTHDAILVGVNTIIKDNPSLTTRQAGGGKSPVRFILDTNLRTPIDSKIVSDGLVETWIVTGSNVKKEKMDLYKNRNVHFLQMDSPKIEIKTLLKEMATMGITSLFVEGGAEVLGSFLKERAFQQVITYIAPKLIGGRTAPTSFGGEGISEIHEALDLEIDEVKKIGSDIRIISKAM